MQDSAPKITEAKQKIVDELLKDLPSNAAVEVDLPSENRVYTLDDPSLPVTLRPMTFDDEKALISSAPGQDPVNIILQKCLGNLKVPTLLPMDKLYLIMKLREISYGDDYNVLLICNKCSAENPSTIQLSQLNVNPVPDDFSDPIKITLPTSNLEVEIHLPRVKDERWTSDVTTGLENIWRFVNRIGEHADKSIICAVLDGLNVIDMRTILNAMKADFGVDTNVKFSCSECKGVSVVDLPIDANFFDVS
jgi:hypothetical protein